MKLRQWLPALMLVACALPLKTVRADTVLYDAASLVHGQQAFVQSFNLTAPGTLTITVSNIPWLDVVADLTCFLSTSKGVIGTPMGGAGSESFNVGAGTIYAHWFGDAQGLYDAGVLGVKIQFHPAAAVPLPRSIFLMLSVLGVWFLSQRKAAFHRPLEAG